MVSFLTYGISNACHSSYGVARGSNIRYIDILAILATPVTLCQGWQSGSNIRYIDKGLKGDYGIPIAAAPNEQGSCAPAPWVALADHGASISLGSHPDCVPADLGIGPGLVLAENADGRLRVYVCSCAVWGCATEESATMRGLVKTKQAHPIAHTSESVCKTLRTVQTNHQRT